jgi:hypothetical protein
MIFFFFERILGLLEAMSYFYLDIRDCRKWWCITVVLALRRLRQEDHEFKASLGYS